MESFAAPMPARHLLATAVVAAVAAVAVAAVAGPTKQSGDARVKLAAVPSEAAFAESAGAGSVRVAPAPAPVPPGPGSAELRRAIEAANASWLAAFRRGDTAELASRYTADANVIPPDGAPLQGRERIAAYFAGQHDAGLRDLALHTVDVVRVGELAYETGTWTSRRDASAGLVDSGRYFAIWKAGADGTWTCKVGTWNSGREAVSAR